MVSRFLVLPFVLLSGFCLLLGPNISFAGEVDDAVLKTQQDLRQSDRSKMINTPKAQMADQNVRQTVGSENADQAYAISADILPLLMNKAGSPEEAAKLLQQAQQDPAGFLKSLPPEIQQQIKDLAGKVQKDPSFQKGKSSP